MDNEFRGAIGVHNTAVEEGSWDGPKAVAAMPNEASVLRYCHAWVDGEGDADAKQSYKFPHHREQGGPAVLAGVRNALARLGQADIPEGDRAGVERHLRAHLEKGKEADQLRLGIERRYYAEEMRVNAEGMIEGYAAVFGQWSEDLGGFRERIRRGAFAKTVQESDVRALFNHDVNYVLGRNRAGTLQLLEDDHGLEFRAKAPETGWANDLRVSIGRGDINQASFGFATIRDEWGNGEGKMRQRELVEVKLFDVSVVTFPAYPQTQVSARSLAEMFIARIEEEGDKGEARKMIEYLRGELAALDEEGSRELAAGSSQIPTSESGNDAPGLEPHPSIAELKRRIRALSDKR